MIFDKAIFGLIREHKMAFIAKTVGELVSYLETFNKDRPVRVMDEFGELFPIYVNDRTVIKDGSWARYQEDVIVLDHFDLEDQS